MVSIARAAAMNLRLQISALHVQDLESHGAVYSSSTWLGALKVQEH